MPVPVTRKHQFAYQRSLITWPPPAVRRGVRVMNLPGVAKAFVDRSRRQIADFLGCEQYRHIIYAYNATAALNLAIKGTLKPGDHVVTTSLEHNSVLRPLERLKREGVIDYTVVELDADGHLDLQRYHAAFRATTALAAVTHASNVTGVINPVPDLIAIAHERGAKVLVDASQSAGLVDIAIDLWEPDFLAFTGHKSLLSLPGIGGLYVKDEKSLSPLIEGGTGGNSFSLVQPGYLPDKFEAGTCNYTGIVALGAGVEFILSRGRASFIDAERELLERLTRGLQDIPGIQLYGPLSVQHKTPVISLNLEGYPSGALAAALDSDYGIMTRPGLQCAPLVHRSLGTHPGGTVRLSLGWTTTAEDCDYVMASIRTLAKHHSSLRPPN